jgi:hypothetical protein
MEHSLDGVRAAFSEQTTGVLELLDFDNLVVDHLVGGLDGIVEELERKNQHSVALIVRNRLALLRNIRSAQSLRRTYETIHNQCVVLLVSYFDATMGDLFKVAVACALRNGRDVPAQERSVELSWKNLSKPEVPLAGLIADRIVAEDDISFQDMQSIRRAFSKNLKIDLGRDANANDIILGQAARHIMAHAGGKIDDRFINQVSGASPRRLKVTLVRGIAIQFDPNEIRVLSSSMTAFIEAAIEKVTSMLEHGGK